MGCEGCSPRSDTLPDYKDATILEPGNYSGRILAAEGPRYATRGEGRYAATSGLYATETASLGSPFPETSTDYEGSSFFPNGIVPVAEASRALVREPTYRDSHPVTQAARAAWPEVTATLNEHFGKEQGRYSTFEGLSVGAMDPAYVLALDPETGAIAVAEILGQYEPETRRLSLSKALPPTTAGIANAFGHELIHDFDSRRGYIARCLDRYGEARGRACAERHAYDLADRLFGEPDLSARERVAVSHRAAQALPPAGSQLNPSQN